MASREMRLRVTASLQIQCEHHDSLLYPNADPTGLIPNFGFGGVPSTGQVTTFAGLPYYNANPITNVTDNVSMVISSHTLKFGGFVEYAIKHRVRPGHTMQRSSLIEIH